MKINNFKKIFILFTLVLVIFYTFKNKNLLNSNSAKISQPQQSITTTIQHEIKQNSSILFKSGETSKDSTNAEQPKDVQQEVNPAPPPDNLQSEAEYRITEFFLNIPRISSLRDLSDEEVHTTPSAVRESGRYLAEMREFFIKNPQSLEVEFNFYLRCANEQDIFDSTRSVCAARASQNFKKLTGKVISPLVFDKRIAYLKELVEL